MILAILYSALLIGLCTALHYGALRLAAGAIRPGRATGAALMLAVGLIAVAHSLEALIYAGAFWHAAHGLGIGTLTVSGQEGEAPAFMDYFYFSLVNLTTLGRGDLVPNGHLRFMTGAEAFHGFLLITASGSFVLQVMAGRNPFRGG
ncbi:potassium channel family protein [Jannaschia sp. W003]|uniref:potassium channel family protein n=1 Tax=Jannaschia sp. W003 TaxID=2867012 RepID=UPI0021A3E699|nr:potassium channel family protein [Jannaschia sp. W003]UWQ22237.1 potassium channel family protein [Jannaschia sp. W003]